MADIELVIKIPEKIYKYVQQIGSINMLDTQQVANAIFDGKPLPKGHGRLIDADSMWNAYHDLDYDFYEALDLVDTILGSDKEQES